MKRREHQPTSATPSRAADSGRDWSPLGVRVADGAREERTSDASSSIVALLAAMVHEALDYERQRGPEAV